MKAISRRPVSRAAVWLLTLALSSSTLLFGSASAHAQAQQLRVLLADFTNKNTGTSDSSAVTATAAVYNELVNSGQGRFDVIPSKEVRTEARAIGLRVPSNDNQPANFSKPDLIRLAKQLTADAIIQGDVIPTPVTRGRLPAVGLEVTVTDVASGETINGGVARSSAQLRPGEPGDTEELLTKSIENAAQSVVQQMVQRQLVTATILNLNQETVILNRGVRDGIHVGDELVVLREGANAQKVREGSVKIVRAYATDSEAEITENVGGIRPEDYARVVYHPAVIITGALATVHPNVVHNPFNFSTIGATLTAIGLGVLIASGTRGGQTSVTNVAAEATAIAGAPAVRVSWSDTIFGQAGVQQYHIWRVPGFPFTPNFAGSTGTGNNGGNGGTGGGTGTTFLSGLPIGDVPGITHTFTDYATPFSFYASGGTLYSATGNGGIGSGVTGTGTGNNGGGNTGGGNTGGSGSNGGSVLSVCTTVFIAAQNGALFPTGFQPGTSYTYQVSALIVRQTTNTSTGGTSGGAGGGTGGNTGGGTGGGTGGNNNNNGFECIETDPVNSGQCTPVTPVVLTAPLDQATAVNIQTFSPTFTSRTGADEFQVEITTGQGNRTFSNPNAIYRIGPIYSNAPYSDSVTQTVPAFDLRTISQLLADTNFANFINGVAGAQPPQIFIRVGARNSGDAPGPIHWFSKNSQDGDKTWRWVYSQPVTFTPAKSPPPPPGKAYLALNRLHSGRALQGLPLPGDTAYGRAVRRNSVPTIQDILTGGRRH